MNALKMYSSNLSLCTKSCSCASVTFQVGIVSWLWSVHGYVFGGTEEIHKKLQVRSVSAPSEILTLILFPALDPQILFHQILYLG